MEVPGRDRIGPTLLQFGTCMLQLFGRVHEIVAGGAVQVQGWSGSLILELLL